MKIKNIILKEEYQIKLMNGYFVIAEDSNKNQFMLKLPKDKQNKGSFRNTDLIIHPVNKN